MDRNRLGEETSPYLLQHKDNPVHWQAWSEATLAAAKAADKPILLSIGYAACHWCHVMAHESFENGDIAERMNDHFINVKVDREERPDLDQIYQHALALMGEHGGWPLTMFLTPDGEPFWGGTYFPPEPRWGRPGFPQILEAISTAYVRDREKVTKNVVALREALQRLARPERGGSIAPEQLDRIAERLLREVDQLHGGIGTAPKFPQTGILELLWHAWKRSGQTPYRDAVAKALDAMCQGGIYDHLGGGFSRYSTDERWLVPHFEKMLYDNAELVDLLTLVWQETHSPLYSQRVEETLDWVRREMLSQEGGFASSLDADSEHEEGKFYVWSEAEIDALLGERAALFKRFYDVDAQGNWEGHTILNRLKAPALADAETERELARCRALLFQAREPRVRPGLDDKVLADWNGLMIAAIANAGIVFERPAWIEMAQSAFDFVLRYMTAPDGRLSHSWRDGHARHPASVDDYANLCRAALALQEATGQEALLTQVRDWIAILDHHYWDETEGGYFFAADDTAGLLTRPKTAADSAVPAGNGTLIGILCRLAALTGEQAYRRRAEIVVEAFSGEIERNFFPLATFLNNVELLHNPLQIVLVGERQSSAFEALRRAVYGVSLPARIITCLSPGGSLPADHPAFGKGLVDGKPAAYVCQGAVCSLPVTDVETLLESLARLR
ncbi:MAG: thioredoxin domain-containing protein [Alphaproteobacteria bacterium]|nr:MAG: thioredoxin domain-containing protein [Alphaproteobacteria bacterium]